MHMKSSNSEPTCSGADAFARLLRDQGVDRVFSVMGNQVNDIAFALQRAGIELITCRHEGTATLMAEAYARTSRRIGVVLVIPGPGLSNTASGLLEAHMNCSPVLVVTVRQPVRFPRMAADKLFHGLDQCEFTGAITGYRATIDNSTAFEMNTRRMLETLLAGRPRPVFLEFTLDFLRQDIRVSSPTPQVSVDPAPSQQQLEEAARLISTSKRALIVAGRAIIASGAEEALFKLAVRSQIPVLTTTLGKGAFPERDPLHLGKLYEPVCSEIIADTDLFIVIGTRLSQVDTADWSIPLSAPIIHIDPEPIQFNSVYNAEVTIAGDLEPTLQRLIPLLDSYKTCWDIPHVQHELSLQRGPLPLAARMLDELLEPGDVLAVDVHEQGYPLVERLALNGQKFLFSGTSLCLGYGIPAAIGARFAQRQGRVLAFCGDGGFLMSSAELATAAHYGLDIVFIVVNDRAYGTIKSHQCNKYGRSIGVDLTNPDFETFSKSFGFMYKSVPHESELYQALTWACAQSRPVVIEIDKSILT